MLSNRDEQEIEKCEEALHDRINAIETLASSRDMCIRDTVDFLIREIAKIQWNINRLHVVTRTGLDV